MLSAFNINISFVLFSHELTVMQTFSIYLILKENNLDLCKLGGRNFNKQPDTIARGRVKK